MYPHRTIFTFYSIAFAPWMVLTLVYVFTLVVGPKDELDPRARRWSIGVVSGVVGLAVLVGAFFYPIWTGMVVPYWFWHAHMWLTTWI
jgi:dolichyl-phosphate-mannose--protein O-mannosyl transferase